jgi:hypothetical protein
MRMPMGVRIAHFLAPQLAKRCTNGQPRSAKR